MAHPNHTQGPWYYATDGGTVALIVESDGTTVAQLSTGLNTTAHSHLDANARLIAAAPDLLEALRPFANIGEYRELRSAMAKCLRRHEQDGFLVALEKARAAVKKADGRIEQQATA